MNKLKKGTYVKVYSDPATAAKFVGIARLWNFNSYCGHSFYPQGADGPARTLESWGVSFETAPKRVVDHWISPQDAIKANQINA